jgi:hypothetical protein
MIITKTPLILPLITEYESEIPIYPTSAVEQFVCFVDGENP